MKINQIKTNPSNPRFIKDDKFKKLVKSIKDFPKMMELRPIIIDENNMVLGGNMRLKALEELKYIDIPENWVKKENELTEDQKKEFIIKDNVGFGDWEWEQLSNEWDAELLDEWGLDMPNFDIDDEDEDQEDNDQCFENKKMEFVFTKEQYEYIEQRIEDAKKREEFCLIENYGNSDMNANALYAIVSKRL